MTAIRTVLTRSVFATVLVVAWLAPAAVAGPTEFCLPDTNGDGHPLFGGTVVRASTLDNYPYSLALTTSLATGDLDQDGDQDIVATNVESEFAPENSKVAVFTNFGDGVFEDGVQYDGGPDVKSAQLGDLDGDGDLDLAVVNTAAGTASILFNNGDATFGAPTSYPVGVDPRALLIADLDNDGDLDLAVLNMTSADLSVLSNDGAGTFTLHGTYPAGNVSSTHTPLYPFGAGVMGPFMGGADLDGDGDFDLAIPALEDVVILPNDGDGAFSDPVAFAAGGAIVWAAAVGDMNADGLPDIVTANAFAQSISVLLNVGSGGFPSFVPYAIDFMNDPDALYLPSHTALGDLDQDGDLDVIVGFAQRMKVVLFFNTGDGTLGPTVPNQAFVDIGENPMFSVFADANGDGTLDLLAINRLSGTSRINVVFNAGQGKLLGHQEFPVSFRGYQTEQYPWSGTRSVGVADLNSDGAADILGVNGGGDAFESSVSVALNSGDGKFGPLAVYELPHEPSEPLTVGCLETAVFGDLDVDGDLDIVVADRGRTLPSSGYAVVEGGHLWVLFNDGNGAFTQTVPYPTDDGGGGVTDLAIADLDADQDLDLVAVSRASFPTVTPEVPGRVTVFVNDGAGNLAVSGSFDITTNGLGEARVALADLDNDGDVDVVAFSGAQPSSGVKVYQNQGNATFSEISSYPVFAYPRDIELADLDADGNVDLIVANNDNPVGSDPLGANFGILFNDGTGVFGPPSNYWLAGMAQVYAIEATDMNHDGSLDLAMSAPNGDCIAILFNAGDGTFAPARYYMAAHAPFGLKVDDLDGDGDKDLVVACVASSSLSILWNRRCGAPVLPGDLNGDASVDLADYALFGNCFTGPGASVPPNACMRGDFQQADLQTDDDIDLRDFRRFSAVFTGP